MKDLFGSFVGILLLAVLAITGMSVISAGASRNGADRDLAAYTAQIEDSAFSADTIRDVITQAQARGYGLSLSLYHHDDAGGQVTRVASVEDVDDTADVSLARIDLTFNMRFVFLDVSAQHTLTAYAR